MQSIRAIAATIVAVCAFNDTQSLFEYKFKNIQIGDRLNDAARVQPFRGLVESVVAGDPSATESQEFEI